MSSKVDQIVDRMAEIDREAERKNNMLNAFSEPAECPASTSIEVDHQAQVVSAKFESVKSDSVTEVFANPDDQVFISSEPSRRVVPTTYTTDLEDDTEVTVAPRKTSTKWSNFVGNVKSFFTPQKDKAPSTMISDEPTRTSALSIGNGDHCLRRRRPENVLELIYETFAYLDQDKDGLVTKDETWIYVCEMCKSARAYYNPNEFDLNEWLCLRDEFEDNLSVIEPYKLNLLQFTDVVAQINLDNARCIEMMKLMIKELTVDMKR